MQLLPPTERHEWSVTAPSQIRICDHRTPYFTAAALHSRDHVSEHRRSHSFSGRLYQGHRAVPAHSPFWNFGATFPQAGKDRRPADRLARTTSHRAAGRGVSWMLLLKPKQDGRHAGYTATWQVLIVPQFLQFFLRRPAFGIEFQSPPIIADCPIFVSIHQQCFAIAVIYIPMIRKQIHIKFEYLKC